MNTRKKALLLILALAVLVGCAGTKQTYIKETYASIASIAEVVSATMNALDDLYYEGQLSQETADMAALIHKKYRIAHITLSIALEHYAKLPQEGEGLAPIGTEELMIRIIALSAELQELLAQALTGVEVAHVN